MRFYEVLILAPKKMTAGELQARSRGVADQIDANIEILSATVHAREQEGTGKNGGTVFMVDIDNDRDAMYEFSGAFARVHDELVINFTELNDETLALKGNRQDVADFIHDELVINFTELNDETLALKGNRQDVADFINREYNINVKVEDDGMFVTKSGDDDDDTFTIDMPDDLHG